MVILEKTPISKDRLDEFFTASKMKLEMQNDIYRTYQLQTPPHLNGTARRREEPADSLGTQRGTVCVSVCRNQVYIGVAGVREASE